MNKFTDPIDTSDELFIQRYRHGVKLVTDDLAQRTHIADTHRVSNIFSLPINIYLLDSRSTLKRANEPHAETFQCDSPAELVNKTLFQLTSEKEARRITRNDQMIIKSGNANIFNEEAMLNNGAFISALSVKMPLYNHENRITGIFGYAIILGKHNLSENLKKMMSLGLLNHHYQESSFGNLDFSKRQSECLYWLVRGKTSKEIANILGLSARTVEMYLGHIKSNLGVKSKSQLIEKVLDQFL